MFMVDDTVQFAVRYLGSTHRNKGGVARLKGVVTALEPLTVSANGETFQFRKLKGGWVVLGERDDPKGRLYLRKYEEAI